MISQVSQRTELEILALVRGPSVCSKWDLIFWKPQITNSARVQDSSWRLIFFISPVSLVRNSLSEQNLYSSQFVKGERFHTGNTGRTVSC